MMNIDLDQMAEEQLLGLRLCELPISIAGTWLEECVDQLYQELEQKGLKFKPACYLADEWLTPEHETCIGIPFYLAHPALTRLEKKMMLEVEGGTKEECMQLLRHEAGHALCYAFGLNKKRKWKNIFGSSHEVYEETYRFRPYSKSFVRHLEGFYAQYHPDEDFVETFAVWLSPEIDWQKKYQGWPVARKLKYVDELMKGIQGKDPLVRSAKKYWHIQKLKITLNNFYKKKRRLRAEDLPDFHDANLKKIFVLKDPDEKNAVKAVDLIRKYRRDLLNKISRWSGEKKYVANDILKTVHKRCRDLKLRTDRDEVKVVSELGVYVTTLIMNYLYTGWYRGDKNKRKT